MLPYEMQCRNMCKQNPRMAEFGGGLWCSPGPTPPLKSGQLQPAAGGLGTKSFSELGDTLGCSCLWRWRNQYAALLPFWLSDPSAMVLWHKHRAGEPMPQAAVCIEEITSVCMRTRECSRQDNFVMHHMTIKAEKINQPLSVWNGQWPITVYFFCGSPSTADPSYPYLPSTPALFAGQRSFCEGLDSKGPSRSSPGFQWKGHTKGPRHTAGAQSCRRNSNCLRM